jgi:hypothetical protein
VLYISDEINGVQKYSLVGSSWVLSGAVGTDADDYRGLAITKSGSVITIFATRKGANLAAVGGGELVTLVDAGGYNNPITGTATVIATAITDKASFRGIALAPQQAPLCTAPGGLNIYDVSPAGASFSWNNSNAASYEYATTTSSIPPASGTITTASSYTATGLTQGQTYYFHVRANCAGFINSSWTTVLFVPDCKGPDDLTITNRGYTADVKWNTVFGSAGYEYAVTNSITPPLSGTAITDTSFTAVNLQSVTQYYVHVRSNCAAGGYSSWTTKMFKTSCLNPVVTNVRSNSKERLFTWNKVNGALNYEYALTVYPTPPVGGAVIQDTLVRISNLDAGTNYYLQVRTKCVANDGESVWTTIPFQTTGLNAYPNPVDDILTVKIYGLQVNTAYVYIADIMGRVVKKVPLINNGADIDVRTLSKGLYIVKYSNGAHEYSVKILKK